MGDSYDVLVVGGGPGGLAAAREAALGGARTLLLERSSGIGVEVRTSGGSFVENLTSLGVPMSFCHPITRGVFLAPVGSVEYSYARPIACVLDVRGLYQFMATEAIEAGVTLVLDATATAVDLAGPVVRYRHLGVEKSVAGRIVIDASGYAGRFAVALGLREPFERLGVGAEYDYYAPKFPQDTAVLGVGSQVAPSGYAWAFPWGKGRVRVGVGILRPDAEVDPRRYLAQLPIAMPQLGSWLQGASPIEYHTGVIPGSRPLRAWTVGTSYVAIGDAGNHASALVGEGIRFAIESGQLAGRLATSGVGISAFDVEWARRHGRRFKVAYKLNERMSRYSDDQWNRRLEDLRAFVGPKSFARLVSSDFSAWAIVSSLFERPSGLAHLARRLVAQVR